MARSQFPTRSSAKSLTLPLLILLASLAFMACAGDTELRDKFCEFTVLEVVSGNSLLVQWQEGQFKGKAERLVLQGIYPSSSPRDPYDAQRREFLGRIAQKDTKLSAQRTLRGVQGIVIETLDMPTEARLPNHQSLNLLLLERGLSPAYIKYNLYFPARSETANLKRYLAAEDKARTRGVGLWGDPAARPFFSRKASMWRSYREARRMDIPLSVALILLFTFIVAPFVIRNRQNHNTARLLIFIALLCCLIIVTPVFLAGSWYVALVVVGPGLYYLLIGYYVKLLRSAGVLDDIVALFSREALARAAAQWAAVMVMGALLFGLAFKAMSAIGYFRPPLSLLESILSSFANMVNFEVTGFGPVGDEARMLVALEPILALLFTAIFLGLALAKHATSRPGSKGGLLQAITYFLLTLAGAVCMFANGHFLLAYYSERTEEALTIREAFYLSTSAMFALGGAGLSVASWLQRIFLCIEALLGIFLITAFLGYIIGIHVGHGGERR